MVHLCYEKGYFSVYFEITPQLHKAIHKQLEELGWLDEDNE